EDNGIDKRAQQRKSPVTVGIPLVAALLRVTRQEPGEAQGQAIAEIVQRVREHGDTVDRQPAYNLDYCERGVEQKGNFDIAGIGVMRVTVRHVVLPPAGASPKATRSNDDRNRICFQAQASPANARRKSGLYASIPEASQDSLDRANVATTKQPNMNQQRIEIVDIAPRLEKAGLQRAQLPVALEKRRVKGVEQGRERQFDFGMRVVNGRVEKASDTPVLRQNIGRP